MAIQSSTIKIYADREKTIPVKNVYTSGSLQTIPVNQLSAGTLYYATAIVVDEYGLTSAESDVYQFYTLPDISYYQGVPPTATNTSIEYRVIETTDDVTVAQAGVAYSTNSDMSNYTIYYDPERIGEGAVNGLNENTTYYVAPYVLDGFNRPYINYDDVEPVATGYNKPVVAWTGVATLGTTTWSQDISITSTPALSAVTVTYTPTGGSASSQSLSTTTGTQTVSLTNLTPNTTYDIVVSATNSAGTTYSSHQSITTNAASISIAATLNSLSNTTNIANVTSTITKGNDITLASHSICLCADALHASIIDQTNQSSPYSTTYTTNLSNLDENETYYIFSKATYTVTGDATVYTIWSSEVQVDTYSLISLGNITTTNTTASIPYSVAGSTTSVNVDISSDGTNWTALPASSGSGTATATGLTVGTTYQVRARCQSSAGWSGYTTSSFTTTAVASTVTITNIDNITPTECDVTITVE